LEEVEEVGWDDGDFGGTETGGEVGCLSKESHASCADES
jgi:hypothetical protein